MRSVLFGVVMCVCLVGCGGPTSSTTTPAPKADVPVDSSAELKKMLEEIANTGATGSAAAGLRPSIQQLAKTDAAKGAALLKQLDQLEAEQDPTKIKALAKKMAEQL